MSRFEVCCTCDEPVPYEDIIWAEGDKVFCPDCADEELVECDYCGGLRFPENLFEYMNEIYPSKWNGKQMCIGCIDKASDEDFEIEQEMKEVNDA